MLKKKEIWRPGCPLCGAETWFDWSTGMTFCLVCGCAEGADGTHFQVQVELIELRKFCVESNGGRGIWKVIDEQRELFQLLQSCTPEVLRSSPRIEGQLARTDMFLVNLTRLLGLPDKPVGFGGRFPRPWPGSHTLKYLTPLAKNLGGLHE